MGLRKLVTIVSVAAACLGVWAAQANAYVYWTNLGASTQSIGRADLGGSNVNQHFISTELNTFGLALGGPYLYWTDYSGTPNGQIGRANLDGSGADQTLLAGLSDPTALSVSGSYIYVAENYPGGSILRTNVDGSGSPETIVNSAIDPNHVVASGSYVYWTNNEDASIGRAALDGSGANENFINTGVNPVGVTVNGSYIYWSNPGVSGGSIGRANLNGTGASPSFITNAGAAHGLAVDASHIYWANFSGASIGRASLDGTNVDPTFITGANEPESVAVDSGGPAVPAPTKSVKLKVKLTTCTTEVITRHGHKTKRQRCVTTTVGVVKVSSTGIAKATLLRGETTYATGTAGPNGIALRARRQVRAGRFTLRLKYAHSTSKVSVKLR
jgi:virginiamycin B lyase